MLLKNYKVKGLFLLMLLPLFGCSVHTTTAYTDLETKCIGSELDGSYTLRVAGRARNAADAYIQAGKQAVYDVLFTLIPVQSGVSEKNIKPLLMEVNAKEKYASYINQLLKDNGDYLTYMSMKEKRIGSSSFQKTNSTAVCVTTICVYREELRQRLINDGILKQ